MAISPPTPFELDDESSPTGMKINPSDEDNACKVDIMYIGKDGKSAGEKKSAPKTKKISTTFSLINMVRAMIGPGCFAMPLCFKQAGLWGAMILDFLLGFLSIICMIKLVRSAQYLVKKNKSGPLDYGNLAGAAFASSNSRILRKLEHVARWVVNGVLIILQFGITSIYYLFVLEHLKEVLDVIFPNNGLSRDSYFLIVLPAFLILCTVRSVYVMSWFSLFGNVLMLLSLMIILYNVITLPHIHTSKLPAFTDYKGTVMASGAILYALEGQAMVLPLENKMKHPHDMKGMTGVLSVGISLVTIVYAACGFYGYITYGNNVAASITLNLSNSPVDFSVKIMLMLVVFVSYLLQQFPVVEMLFPYVKRPLRTRNVKRAYIIALEYLFRTIFILITLGISYTIPNLDDIIPLFGGSAGMSLSLIFPPTLETVSLFTEWYQNSSRSHFFRRVGVNIFCIVIGAFFVVTGTQANVEKILSK